MMMALLAIVPAVHAEGPDDEYVTIYGIIQQGDAYNDNGRTSEALSRYYAAQAALKNYQKSYPDTYTKVVNFRLNYLANKINELSSQPPKTPATNAPAAPSTNAVPAPIVREKSEIPGVSPVTPKPTSVPAPPASESEAQIKNLQEQVRRLEADRSSLEAKLKEALTALPAAIDPKELTKAQEQVSNLQKENDELKTALANSKTNAPVVKTSSAETEKSQAALADANRKITALAEVNATLTQERNVLQDRVKTLATPDAATAALRDENEILKKQLAEFKTKTSTDSSADATKLKEAEAKIATLQSDKELLRLEKMALESRVKQTATAPAGTNANPVVAAGVDSVTASKIAQLEAQRDEMKKTLDAVSREAQGRKKGAALSARMDELTRQVASFRARIEVLEAHPVPYSDAELALFSQSPTALSASAHVSKAKKRKDLPPAVAAKLSEGQQFFLAGDFDKAEARYKEVLKYDEKNFNVLADLASIELSSGHLDDAEKNIKAAIAIASDDDYNYFVLGKLKFQEKNFDEAFEALSQAAQLNPQNAKIQNFLGMTLSEKGVRGPAETAFRRAIILDPGYADAHINLAVVYATQQPPLLELARWHYQKALSAGHPPSPAVEKLLNPTKTAAVSH